MRATLSLLIAIAALALLSACATLPQRDVSAPGLNVKPGRQARIYSGDTLYSFARRNKVSMRELMDLNHLQAPFDLQPGSNLTLPADAEPLPSVELGPAAYANETEYESRHSAKGVTTYSQIVPERVTDTPPPKSAPAPTKGPKQLLKDEPEAASVTELASKPTDKSALAKALNLQPMQYDKKKKQLKAPTENTKQAKKPLDKDVTKLIRKKSTEEQETAKVETKPDPDMPKLQADLPEEDKRPVHSRIEKKQEPVNFIWPVQGPVISTFGPKSNGLSNDGINIGAPRNTPVIAADGGTVAYAGSDIPGFGNVVLLRHASGLMTTYAHLERMFVQRDVVVAKGDLIGTVGTSGGLDTPQLHFEIRREKEALDPSKYLYR